SSENTVNPLYPLPLMSDVFRLVEGAWTRRAVPVVLLVTAVTPIDPPSPWTPVPFFEVPLTPMLNRPSPEFAWRSCPSSALAPFVEVDPSALVVATTPLPRLLVLFIPAPEDTLLSTRHANTELQDAFGTAPSCARAACVISEPPAKPSTTDVNKTAAAPIFESMASSPMSNDAAQARGVITTLYARAHGNSQEAAGVGAAGTRQL